MPNISLRKQTGKGKRDQGLGTSRKPRPRKRPRKRQTGLTHKDQRSLALHAVDELDNVRDVLDAAPMFNALALMVREVQEGTPPIPPEKRDEIARFAKKHFDFDVDQLTEQPYQMNIINELPGALTAAASWRLERLRRVLQWGLGT